MELAAAAGAEEVDDKNAARVGVPAVACAGTSSSSASLGSPTSRGVAKECR